MCVFSVWVCMCLQYNIIFIVSAEKADELTISLVLNISGKSNVKRSSNLLISVESVTKE